MPRNAHRHIPRSLAEKYPPSEPCGCDICLSYCARPGWWTVAEAACAIQAGLGPRIMLEVSPERTLAVLSPAFKGCEKFFGLQAYASNGCTFLKNNLCELHGTGLQPLECRFCHHARVGQGPKCHADLEKDWDTPSGRALVIDWVKWAGLWHLRHQTRLNWLENPPDSGV